ncbi:MAG: PIN domain-containing protein [Bryobacteraceae bacterium]|nr:PIN domain-containing protein [Bryobacteraceae bacterium]
MILVDTSIWIELLSGRPRYAIREEDLLRFATCGPIVQEVLQGLQPGPRTDAFREAFLAIPVLNDPISLPLYILASEIYQQGRRKGLTIRSSVDCLIAAVAIENRVPVCHRDRDFSAIARFTALDVTRPEAL